MNNRDVQIEEILGSTSNLNANRLELFRRIIRDAYEKSTVIPRLAVLDEQTDRSPSDFRLISNQELRRAGDFNADNVIWDMYCEEIGRSVALGEEAYLFEVLQEQILDEPSIVDVEFSRLHAMVDELVVKGWRPDVLLAPVAYLPRLLQAQRASIDWGQNHRPSMKSSSCVLEVFWSSATRPLNRFIVFDHTVGVWHVKLDPHGGGRLTVAIGEQFAPTHGVVWLAETVAKYEVVDLGGVRSCHADDAPGE
jgi:hypothetical protein